MEENEINKTINSLVEKARSAQNEYANLNQEKIDSTIKAMALAGVDKHMELASMAVEETGMGIYEDKVTKNLFATEYVYHDIKNIKTVGIIEENLEESYYEIAEPVGVIAGVTPVTNPTSTTMFKCLIAVKTRNPIIFSFHPKAQNCSAQAAKLMKEIAIKAGAPEGCIGWIDPPSIEATNLLMKHPNVALILATGGANMVQAAYSSGKPALGVGPGNVPCYIEKSAHIKRAAADLILSKTFDNGVICASEQALVVDEEIAEDVIQELKNQGAYFLTPDEIERLESIAIDEIRCAMNPKIVGQSAEAIAKMVDISVPPGTKVLIAELEGVGAEHPLSREKLSPILAFYRSKNSSEGIRKCEEMTEFGGLGHSAVIHSEDDEVIKEFSKRVRTGRLIVNSPSSHGAIGDIYNTNIPSLTLGCGTMGRNATTANVSVTNLLNVKRVAMRRVNMKWFKDL